MKQPPKDSPYAREDDALARHREALRERFPMPEPKPRRTPKALGAALLLVGLAGGLAWTDPAYRQETYSSAVGEKRSVALSDGSRLTLDSNTRLNVSWHLLSRRVELQAGQALFDVSPTRIRPFLVTADATEVRVLGTLFSVSSFKDSVRVTLVRGRVSVQGAADGQRHVELAPGQQVDARRGHALPPVAVDVEAAIAWKDNRLVFEQTTLAEALEIIQRYHKAPIRLDDPTLASLSISGVFDSADAAGLLTLLPNILPLSLSTEADGTVHVRRKSSKK